MKKGETLLLLTRLAAMDPEHVSDPEAFRPDRWSDPKTATRLQRSGAFTPFGSGPRMCPGRSLALLEMRMVLAMLYRNFRVERVGTSEDVTERFGFVVSPAGLRVRLHHAA